MQEMIQHIANTAKNDFELVQMIRNIDFDELQQLAFCGTLIACKATDNVFTVKAYKKSFWKIFKEWLDGKLYCLYTIKIERHEFKID